jgi:hypothetical protein
MFAPLRSIQAIATAGFFLLLGSIALVRTNPTHVRHAARLFPGPVPLDLLPEPPQSEVIRRNHPPTSNTAYHDLGICSLTRSKSTGALSTVGVLGMVFDLRTDAQREFDRLEFEKRREPPAVKLLAPIRPHGLVRPANAVAGMDRAS